MSSLDQLTQAGEPPPAPPRSGRRRLLVVAVVVAAAALVGLLVTVATTAGGGSSSTGAAPGRPGPIPTLDPSARSSDEAAVRHDWPLVAGDEFTGSALDTSRWSPYRGRTTDGVGQHSPDNISVGDGIMTITSHGDQSGGMAWSAGQKYGRWEVRARTQAASGYGSVLLLWPDAENWPTGGEIDFLEIPKPERTVNNFTVHYGGDNRQDATQQRGDFTGWHDYAVEWEPDHIAGFVDGVQVFRTSNPAEIPPGPMHLAIQQDVGPFENWVPAPDASTPARVTFQVDWVRIYAP